MNLGTRNKINVSAGMSSMTDLVFLLLIFFIIISTLVSNGVNVDLPQSKGSTSSTPDNTLSINADGSYYWNGTAKAFSEIERIMSSVAMDSNKKVLYLQVDKSVPTGSTVEVIGLAKANSWKVMLGSQPKN